MVAVKRATTNDNCRGASSRFGQSLYRMIVANVTKLLPLVVGNVEDINNEVLIVNPMIEIILQVVYRAVLKFIYLLV